MNADKIFKSAVDDVKRRSAGDLRSGAGGPPGRGPAKATLKKREDVLANNLSTSSSKPTLTSKNGVRASDIVRASSKPFADPPTSSGPPKALLTKGPTAARDNLVRGSAASAKAGAPSNIPPSNSGAPSNNPKAVLTRNDRTAAAPQKVVLTKGPEKKDKVDTTAIILKKGPAAVLARATVAGTGRGDRKSPQRGTSVLAGDKSDNTAQGSAGAAAQQVGGRAGVPTTGPAATMPAKKEVREWDKDKGMVFLKKNPEAEKPLVMKSREEKAREGRAEAAEAGGAAQNLKLISRKEKMAEDSFGNDAGATGKKDSSIAADTSGAKTGAPAPTTGAGAAAPTKTAPQQGGASKSCFWGGKGDFSYKKTDLIC